LNGYIGWLPGNETSLNEEQLKQAFYDAMPSTWRERYIQAGHSSVSMTIAQLLRYFRQQEHLAIQKQIENQTSQRSQHKASTPPKHRFTPRGSVKEVTTEKRYSGSASKSKSKTTVTGKRIADTAPCPVHPDMGHNWGDCYSNAYNKKRNTDDHSKKDKSKSTNFAVETSASSLKDDNVKMNSGSKDEFLNNNH
jgi:hypothetical protein